MQNASAKPPESSLEKNKGVVEEKRKRYRNEKRL